MLRRPCAALLGAAALAWSSSASALGDVTVYDNAQSVPVGGRAAGMGGAYTALACDEGALHYNPASLSCAAASHLELTANAYVLQGLRATGALGPGGNVSATTFHAVPTIVGAVRILAEGKERTYFDTYPQRLTFGFTVSVPRTVALEVEPPRPDDRNFASSSVREDLTAGDIGLGYQFNKEVSVGVALGGVLRTSARHASWLLARDAPSACAAGACNDFRAFNDDRSSLAVGGRVKLGLLVRPYKNLSFGLQLTAPSIHVYGFARQSSTLTQADGGGYAATLLRARGSSEVGLPARVALGFAYVKRRYTFSADASVNFARNVRLAHDMTAQAIDGQGVPGPVPDLAISPGVQPNVNLGASVPFGPTKEVNIGFFTDLSSVSEGDVKRLGLSRVDMFGGSMTLGLLGKQSRAWIGLSGEIGHATAKVPGREFTYQGVSALPGGQLPSESEATIVRWTMTGILGSNYSFLE
ncbi:MAG TPA: hypothetical protein VLT33_12600 [Labilithrix sp.]|nr:hypothetical protein [Labilithrix sp.]